MIYLREPNGFHVDFRVVGCFVESDGDILQLLRAKDREIGPGKWASPAGKIEANESPEAAMLRELKEETEIVIAENQLLRRLSLFVKYPDCVFRYTLFVCRFPFKPEIKLNHEHVAFVWIPPACASSLNLIEDQLECIKLVYGL